MKLLLDQNLAFTLAAGLVDLFPGSSHVRDVGLERADDEAVWAFARDHGYTIASKDSDFRQRSFLYGAPPRVIWLDVGNCTTSHVESLLRARAAEVAAFESDPGAALLVLR